MTIHRALSELKLIDAKIEKEISTVEPLEIYQKDKKINGHLTLDEFTKKAQSSYDSCSDLIKRKTEIKSAIVKSNSSTVIKVAGKEMTIADAITEKKILEQKRKFLDRLKDRKRVTTGVLNKNNEQVKANCNVIIQHTVGKEAVTTKTSEVESLQKMFMETNEFMLHDPLKIDEKIENLEKQIETFETEIDAVLSESNAITIIEI